MKNKFNKNIHTYIHTYVHNWLLQPFSQDYVLASHTTHVVYAILYLSGGTYSLTSTPKDIFLRNFPMASLFTLRVFARNPLRGNHRRYIFFFIFRFDA